MSEQAPKQIYLQSYNSDCYDDNTWCVDQINEEYIEYILQSEYNKLRAENERLREALNEIYDVPNISNVERAIECVHMMQDIAQQALNEVTK